jgi:outer membrane protein W
MKRLYLSAVVFLLVVGFSANSSAEGYLPLDGSIGVGARVFGMFPKGDKFLGQKLDFENEVGGEVNVTYRFLKYLALEAGVGYTQFDARNKTLGVNWATIEALPIYATLQVRWVSSKPEELKWIVPYFAIGGGYYLLDIDEKSGLRNFWLPRGVLVDLEIDDTFFFHLGGGADIFLTDHLALVIDAKYSWATTDIDETQTTGLASRTFGDTVNLNAAYVGAGFKFFF